MKVEYNFLKTALIFRFTRVKWGVGSTIIQKMYPTSTQFLKYEQNQHWKF